MIDRGMFGSNQVTASNFLGCDLLKSNLLNIVAILNPPLILLYSFPMPYKLLLPYKNIHVSIARFVGCLSRYLTRDANQFVIKNDFKLSKAALLGGLPGWHVAYMYQRSICNSLGK